MKLNPSLEKYRYQHGLFRSPPGAGFGCFRIPGPCGRDLLVCSSTGVGEHIHGWEHVSVSAGKYCPNWREMCFVKDLFWSEDEIVMQLHPAKADWINNHSKCLHMWRPTDREIPMPPPAAVGFKELGDLEKKVIAPAEAFAYVEQKIKEAERKTGTP